MNTLSNMERMNLSNAKALRRAREQIKVTKVELVKKLDVSVKTIDRLEKAEGSLTGEKIKDIINALGISETGFARVKKGRGLLCPRKREWLVTENALRRSYKKVITKEVQVLRTIRKMKGISQYQASSLCGHSRPSIGHIELDRDRIFHIVASYGFDVGEFERLMHEGILREDLLESCHS